MLQVIQQPDYGYSNCLQYQQVTSATIAKESAESLASETEFEFADVDALTCLLCARQFKSIEQLKRHNKESGLHMV